MGERVCTAPPYLLQAAPVNCEAANVGSMPLITRCRFQLDLQLRYFSIEAHLC